MTPETKTRRKQRRLRKAFRAESLGTSNGNGNGNGNGSKTPLTEPEQVLADNSNGSVTDLKTPETNAPPKKRRLRRTARADSPTENGSGSPTGLTMPEAIPDVTPEVELPKKKRRLRKAFRADSPATENGNGSASHFTVTSYRNIASEELLEDLRLGWLSRELDHRQLTLHKQGRSYFHIAGSGHEALLTALARSLRSGYDWFFPYYRDLTLALALGISPDDVLLHSVGSSDDRNSAGRQMPHHFSRKELHIISQSSPTGSQCLVALGCAEASRYIAGRDLEGLTARSDEITYVSIGDGATSEGEVWESFNTASRLKLPIVYLVADNGYAISLPTSEQAAAPISDLVAAYPNFFVGRFDGCDYFASREVGAQAIQHVRSGVGPALLHARVTRPYSHSSSDDQTRYRRSEDLEQEKANDPLIRFERELISAGVLDEESARAIQTEAHEHVAAAAIRALEGARPDPKTATDHLLNLPKIPPPPVGSEAGDENVYFKEAIRRALFEAMESDPKVRVFGEDVADVTDEHLETLEGLGGVFGTTAGLQRKFGSDRCFNTPLAEANIVGRAIGQAVRGLHPSPEIQFFDYIWPAMHQIRSEAATTRWRSNSNFNVPMVLRCPIGGYVTGGAIWHSQSGESIFAHIPGLVVIFPSRARDAAGLLRAAFQCEDPVLFLEHKALLRQRFAMDPYPSTDFVIPLGSAATVRSGTDLTIVTWGATVHRSMLAAEKLFEEGLDVEIIDLRTIIPWDKQAVVESVSRTGRLLVVHEDTLTAGFGGEIAAFAADECFSDLDAPIRRIGAKDAWVGYEPGLEGAVLPQVDDIIETARTLGLY
jgi:2-oxoisovalerate dehydrogenase E1 component